MNTFTHKNGNTYNVSISNGIVTLTSDSNTIEPMQITEENFNKLISKSEITIVNFNDETVVLTEMENLVVKALTGCDEYDERPYLHILDLKDSTSIEMSQLRGVVSSLAQKDVVCIEKDFFRKGDSIVFLISK